MSELVKAYKNLDFLNSPEARTVRILCEYEEPKARLAQHGVENTLVFFGSARAKTMEEAAALVAQAEADLAASAPEDRADREAGVANAKRQARLAPHYENARELARRLTEWDMARSGPDFLVCTGGGPGMMEAANRGAADVEGGRSVGLGISLPFEEALNPYVTPGLDFEFHYFFTRKLWFLYLAKALILFPGGFGTFDEMFETLTLVQTGKISKPLPIVLFGTDYWDKVINIDAMVEWGTISPGDTDLFFRTNSVDDAFNHLVAELEKNQAAAAR
jgi:uncharacterized protein (TIGR00730 family)